MSIGEVITAEFMSGLLHYIYQKLDKNNPEEMNFFKKLKDVNNVRPMKNSFEWLLWFIGDKYSKYEKIIEDALLQSTEGVYKSKYGKLWDKTKIGDQTDIFWILNKIASLRNEKILRKIAGFVGGDDNLPYINGAMEEFSNPKHKNVQYIFYGHTHNGLHRFAGGEPGGKSRLYVNTGTYLPFIDRASDKTFASAYQMTLAFIYSIEEDYDKHKGGRKNAFPTLDLWNGIKKKVYP
jgi:hypothetical protein